MAKELPKRSEVKEEFTWNLNDLFPSDEAFYEKLKEAKKYPDQLKSYQGTLGESAENLLNYYRLIEDIEITMDALVNYSSRKKDQDTKNSTYQAMNGAVMSLYVEISSADAFATPEIIKIDEDKLKKFLSENKELALYERDIRVKRRKLEHTLSEKEEQLLAMAGEIAQGPGNIYATINNADLVFPVIKDKDGNEERLTHGNFIRFMESDDREIRKNTFQSFYSVYGQFKNSIATILNAQVKQLQFFANARKYESSLHAALDETEVPVNVYHSLIDAVHENLPLMHRYVRLRKKLMGVEELHMYDLYASMVPDMEVKVDFEEAKKNILDALQPLGQEYLEILKSGFENRWIDVYENEGKRSGAYSSGAKVHPYVLMNYANTLDSEFTLAHEMGHALHSYLSNRTQPTIYSDYRIFVAEVASTCNESLLMQYLLKNTTDKAKRAYLINHFLEKFRTTLYRQTMFAEFELLINQMVEKGESLTADALCSLYHDLNVKYFGPDIKVDAEIDLEWARIPHFYYNYYVFQYATGYSAAIALSNRILKEGESAVKDYLKFLSSGSSAEPIELLKIAGVDMSTSGPVKEALGVFDKLLDEMEELLG